MPAPSTTTISAGSSARSESRRERIIGRPAILCSTFGSNDFIRVPLPAARTMAAKRGSVMVLARIADERNGIGGSLARERPPVKTQIVAEDDPGNAKEDLIRDGSTRLKSGLDSAEWRAFF